MTQSRETTPLKDELPSHYADRLGLTYSKSVTLQHKKENGQFFTPLPIANLMASMCDFHGRKLHMLDPGCGTCSLSSALIEHLIFAHTDIDSIVLTAYETDSELIPFSRRALKYLSQWLSARHITFVYSLITKDFVLDQSAALADEKSVGQYDFVISNPPYFKLSKHDPRTIASSALVSGQPNIYSFFMGIAARLLKQDGQLVFITPRSFTSGNYFKAFREFFFNEVRLDKIHLFVSRKDTFTRDSVLQETVIIKAIKDQSSNPQVTMSSSHGLSDLNEPSTKQFLQSELVDLNSTEKFLHFPTNDNEESVFELAKSWKHTLKDFNIQISTGPVVAFRAWDYITDKAKAKSGPLFWLHNVTKMQLVWPDSKPNKGQHVIVSKASMPILLPNKNYILLRRFSAKDDKSRLIAAPFFCNSVNADFIGVENKVNYIYRRGGQLNRSEVVGLCALLNSKLFDTYFRLFNGNVNVSATELREMTFPPLDAIKEIGEKIILSNDYSQVHAEEIVNEEFTSEHTIHD